MDAITPRFRFDTSYARLPERFYARVAPTPVRAPRLLKLNESLAADLGFDPEFLASPEGVAVLAGNRVPDGAEPIAMAYAGHQFGGFVPQLGDGRAILLGEVIDREGRRRDLQWKGSGLTPFSRTADGRAALGPVLREYLVSEAMTALGIPSTRALAALATGEMVQRETALPGAILVRVAASHLRIGTFQFFAARRDHDALRTLVGYALERHYPDAATDPVPARALLERVAEAQGSLIARWMLVGFVHGVMNTDNTTISGETIDFGPCAFVDAYDPAAVFSSIDVYGRYAYGNQSRIALWNLARLAEAVLPLLASDEAEALQLAQASIERFIPRFQATWREGLAAKLGLAGPADLGDGGTAADSVSPRLAEAEVLGEAFLGHLAEAGADFTLAFRSLVRAAQGEEVELRALFPSPATIEPWLARWRAALAEAGQSADTVAATIRAASPAIIPRNHRIQQAIDAATLRNDLGPFEHLVEALQRPFDDRADSGLMLPPQPEEQVLQTFCGT